MPDGPQPKRDPEIIRLFHEGKSRQEIARAVGFTLNGVQSALRRLGLRPVDRDKR